MSDLKLNLSDYKRILFEGDSMTDRSKVRWPFLRMMNWDVSWADIFEETIFCWKPEADVTFCNTAVAGSNINKMTARLESVKAFKPDLVMLTGGNNDCAQGVSVEEFEEKFRKYIEELNAIGAKVLAIAEVKLVPNVNDSIDGAIEKAGKKVPYHAAMKRIAEETGNYYFNIGETMGKAIETINAKHPIHSVYSDAGHLNELGARVFCGEILKLFGILNKFVLLRCDAF